MTRRQPNLKEASHLMALGWLGPDWPQTRKWRGVMLEYACADPIASDISQKCFDCGTVIIDCKHQLGIYAPRCTCREALSKRFHTCDCPTWGDRLCTSCGNKRRPAARAAQIWNEQRLFINKTERLLYEHRKNSRPITRASIVNDGRRKEQQTGV